MAQGGGGKLRKAPKSGGSQKRKVVRRNANVGKGKKHKSARRAHAQAASKPNEAVTKSIISKNEALVAAKAIASGCGDKFFLKDLASRGQKEHQSQLKARNKKQDNSSKLTGRLKDQIKQLQQGTKTKK